MAKCKVLTGSAAKGLIRRPTKCQSDDMSTLRGKCGTVGMSVALTEFGIFCQTATCETPTQAHGPSRCLYRYPHRPGRCTVTPALKSHRSAQPQAEPFKVSNRP